jgi:hypothetical protein
MYKARQLPNSLWGQRYVHGTYVGKVEIVVDGKTISDSQSVVI